MKMAAFCSICGSNELVEFNKRPEARCANCGAMERTRLLYEVINREGMISSNMRVLHYHPEPGLAARLRGIAKVYVPADKDASQYRSYMPETISLDLCNFDPKDLGEFDLIVHSHVLQRAPCALDGVLQKLSRLLKSDGRMYFSIPIRRNVHTEEFSASLTPERRAEKSGDKNAYRVFGDQDVLRVLSKSLGEKLAAVDPYVLFSARDIRLMGIKPELKGLSSNTIFRFERKARRQWM